MSYMTGDGMLLIEEVTALAMDEKWRGAWGHLISLLPQCHGHPRRCDNIATHRCQNGPQDPYSYACESCVQSCPEEGPGWKPEDWDSVPWIAHVAAYRLLNMGSPAKARKQ